MEMEELADRDFFSSGGGATAHTLIVHSSRYQESDILEYPIRGDWTLFSVGLDLLPAWQNLVDWYRVTPVALHLLSYWALLSTIMKHPQVLTASYVEMF